VEFLNRSDEVAMLESRIESAEADLLVIYGRRRVGKTELLTHLAGRHRSLYFEATDTVAREQLADMTAELARVTGDPVLDNQPLTNWEAALAAIGRFAESGPALVVLDEFQLLAKQSPELETTLSRWWRATGRKLPITLVLAGSELAFFEDRVLAGQLYGRRTGQLKLLPFLAKEAALFHPGFSPEDRVRAYSICGGVPYYLSRFPDHRSLDESLLTQVIDRSGLLHDEAELMIRQSVAEPANYIAVLRAIATGHNRNSTIGDRTSLEPAHITKVLDTLIRLGLVERVRPITASPRAKKIAYGISDQFLRFHYRFIEPARTRLRTSALARSHLEAKVLPELDHHASIAWEEICQEHVLRTVPDVAAVGRWWGQVPVGAGGGKRSEEREVDVVGVDAHGEPVVAGMCKWTNAPIDFDELNLLDRLIPHIEGAGGAVTRMLFSRSGFTARLRAHADADPRLHLIGPAEVYA